MSTSLKLITLNQLVSFFDGEQNSDIASTLSICQTTVETIWAQIQRDMFHHEYKQLLKQTNTNVERITLKNRIETMQDHQTYIKIKVGAM